MILNHVGSSILGFYVCLKPKCSISFIDLCFYLKTMTKKLLQYSEQKPVFVTCELSNFIDLSQISRKTWDSVSSTHQKSSICHKVERHEEKDHSLALRNNLDL